MGLEITAHESTEREESRSTLESVRKAISEYMRQTGEQSDSNLKTKLGEERRRRESLERRLSELAEDNRRTRRNSEQTERFAEIQSGLRELGVQKVQLAFRLVKDDVFRGEDGALYVDQEGFQLPLKDYLKNFVSENPEFLPPRMAGGSGATGTDRGEMLGGGIDIDNIRPGMSHEELAEAWKEVARLAGHGPNRW